MGDGAGCFTFDGGVECLATERDAIHKGCGQIKAIHAVYNEVDAINSLGGGACGDGLSGKVTTEMHDKELGIAVFCVECVEGDLAFEDTTDVEVAVACAHKSVGIETEIVDAGGFREADHLQIFPLLLRIEFGEKAVACGQLSLGGRKRCVGENDLVDECTEQINGSVIVHQHRSDADAIGVVGVAEAL